MDSLSSERKALQKRTGELKTLIARLYEDKVKGVIDDETFVVNADIVKLAVVDGGPGVVFTSQISRITTLSRLLFVYARHNQRTSLTLL